MKWDTTFPRGLRPWRLNFAAALSSLRSRELSRLVTKAPVCRCAWGLGRSRHDPDGAWVSLGWPQEEAGKALAGCASSFAAWLRTALRVRKRSQAFGSNPTAARNETPGEPHLGGCRERVGLAWMGRLAADRIASPPQSRGARQALQSALPNTNRRSHVRCDALRGLGAHSPLETQLRSGRH